MKVVHPTIRRPATYQDVLDAPPHMMAELIGGALHRQPRPRMRHSRSASRLGQKLAPFDVGPGPGGWMLLIEPELHLAANVLVPDLAGWRQERAPDAVGIETPPDSRAGEADHGAREPGGRGGSWAGRWLVGKGFVEVSVGTGHAHLKDQVCPRFRPTHRLLLNHALGHGIVDAVAGNRSAVLREVTTLGRRDVADQATDKLRGWLKTVEHRRSS